MGYPPEKFDAAVRGALGSVDDALDHVYTFDDDDRGRAYGAESGMSTGGLYRADLYAARAALRRILADRQP